MRPRRISIGLMKMKRMKNPYSILAAMTRKMRRFFPRPRLRKLPKRMKKRKGSFLMMTMMTITMMKKKRRRETRIMAKMTRRNPCSILAAMTRRTMMRKMRTRMGR